MNKYYHKRGTTVCGLKQNSYRSLVWPRAASPIEICSPDIYNTPQNEIKIKLKKEPTSWAAISPLPHVSWCIAILRCLLKEPSFLFLRDEQHILKILMYIVRVMLLSLMQKCLLNVGKWCHMLWSALRPCLATLLGGRQYRLWPALTNWQRGGIWNPFVLRGKMYQHHSKSAALASILFCSVGTSVPLWQLHESRLITSCSMLLWIQIWQRTNQPPWDNCPGVVLVVWKSWSTVRWIFCSSFEMPAIGLWSSESRNACKRASSPPESARPFRFLACSWGTCTLRIAPYGSALSCCST